MAQFSEEINAQLLSRLKLSDLCGNSSVVTKCSLLFQRFPQTVEEFLGRLEAFMINQNLHKIDIDSMGKLEQALLSDFRKNLQSPEMNNQTNKRKTPIPNEAASKLSKVAKAPRPAMAAGFTPGDMIPSTQEPARSLEQSFSQVSGVQYDQRTGSGTTVQTLNDHLEKRGSVTVSNRKPYGIRCDIITDRDDFDGVTERYRSMFTSLEERARAMEKHLLSLQRVMCTTHDISEDSLQPVGIPSQDVVWVCGRVCCDSSDGRINKASVLLEGSRQDSGGRRVPLEFPSADTTVPLSFSLFPGQIILVQGINSSGRKMTVQRIIDGAVPQSRLLAANKVHEMHTSKLYQGGGSLRIFTAAGPFTTSDNLEYEPLKDIFRTAMHNQPDVIVLLGPFVDVSHPLLSTGDVTLLNDAGTQVHGASYEMVFVEKVMRDCLSAFFNSIDDEQANNGMQIVLIPSLLDAHHEFTFPQPPFGDRDHVKSDFFEETLGALNIPFATRTTGSTKRVHLLPNPCMFRINDTLIGACSNDIMFGLSADECNQNMQGNRIQQLAAHVLKQRSFCPQFPIPTNAGLANNQLDMRQARHWEFSIAPDLLILPSKLAPMAKEVNGTVIINPASLAKGRSGGTYADIHIHPIAPVAAAATESKMAVDGEDEEHSSVVPPVPVVQRTRVDIMKI